MLRGKLMLGSVVFIFSQVFLFAMSPAWFERPKDRPFDRRIDRHQKQDRRVEQISKIIVDLEWRSRDFRRSFDRALDRSRLDGTRKEDRLNDEARRLERAFDQLKKSWNRDHDVRRSRNYASTAIEAARTIDRTLSRHVIRGHVKREWDVLRTELDHLADIFDLPQVWWQHWDRDRGNNRPRS